MPKNNAIRLTNKTAIALRRCARRERAVWYAATAVVTAALCVLSVALGIMWLPAVPLTLLGAALIDAALLTLARSRYLSLTGQAICTEACAREIGANTKEKRRREQAMSDLAAVKADMDALAGSGKETPQKADPDEEDEDLYESRQPKRTAPQAAVSQISEETTQRMSKASGIAQTEEAPRRRRKQAAFQVIQGEQAK